MAELLHAGLGWPIATALIGISFFTSFMTAAFGIGGGAAMLAVMATLLPAAAIIPVHGLVQLGSNAGRAAIMLPHLHREVVPMFLAGAVIGIALASIFVVQLDPAMLQICVGLFILWSISFSPPAFMRRSSGVAGAFSSFLTMFFGGTGPFVAAYLKTLRLDRMTHVATHSVLMTFQHLLKSIAFGLLGFAFSAWAGLITLLILSGFLGTVAGRHVLTRIDENLFRIALNVILSVLALRLIYAGGMTFWTEAKGP